jgi:hypothetical protein
MLELTAGIDGWEGSLLLDTGSIYNVIEEKHCRRLKKIHQLGTPKLYAGIDGVQRESLGTCIITISLGQGAHKVASTQLFIVIPDNTPDHVGLSVLVGLPFLADLGASLDIGKRQLHVMRDGITRLTFKLADPEPSNDPTAVALIEAPATQHDTSSKYCDRQVQGCSLAVPTTQYKLQEGELALDYSEVGTWLGRQVNLLDIMHDLAPKASQGKGMYASPAASAATPAAVVAASSRVNHVTTVDGRDEAPATSLPCYSSAATSSPGDTQSIVIELGIPRWSKPAGTGHGDPSGVYDNNLAKEQPHFAAYISDLKDPARLSAPYIYPPPETKAKPVHSGGREALALMDNVIKTLVNRQPSECYTSTVLRDQCILPALHPSTVPVVGVG